MGSAYRKIYNLFVEAGLDAFENRPEVPKWLKDHDAFKDKKTVKKVFPSFGLKNFNEEVDYKPIRDDNFKINIKNDVAWAIKEPIVQLKKIFYQIFDNSYLTNEESIIIEAYSLFFQHITSQLIKSNILDIDNKLKIVFNQDIKLADKTIFRNGDSIFKSFDRINILTEQLFKKFPDLEPSSNYKLPNIDGLAAVKEFHKINIPGNKKYQVVFSADGDKGAWDISTMSMRGIESCQSWDPDNDHYNSCLVGSIISKYVGIIYLTSGSTVGNLGTKMIKRCVVRFGVDTRGEGQPVIIIDQMYPSYDSEIASIFFKSLQGKTSLKVLDYSQGSSGNPEVPIQDVAIPRDHLLKNLDSRERPYKDIAFPDKRKYNFNDNELGFEEQGKIQLYYWRNDIKTKYFSETPSELKGYQVNIYNLYCDVLAGKLYNLISKVMTTNIGLSLSKKYISVKMNQYLDEMSQLNNQSILNRIFTIPSNLSPAELLEDEGLTIDEMRDAFLISVNHYKNLFNEVFNSY